MSNYEVEKGEVTSLKKYLKDFTLYMRNYSSGIEHYEKYLKQAREKYAKLLMMTEEECLRESHIFHENEDNVHRELIAQCEEAIPRLRNMLAKVLRLDVGPAHEDLKKRMVESLERDIESNESGLEFWGNCLKGEKKYGEEWRKQRLSVARRGLDEYQKEYDQAAKHEREHREWVEGLDKLIEEAE